MNSRVSIVLLLLIYAITVIPAAAKSIWSKTPPMGWISSIKFPCQRDCAQAPNTCIGERLVNRTMEAMVKLELVNAGYRFVVLDNCWDNGSRASSSLTYGVNIAQFPRGINAVTQYAKRLNLSFGLQFNEATDGRDTMAADANTAISYGLGLVKMDAYIEKRFTDFAAAFKKSRKDILIACSVDRLIGQFWGNPESIDLKAITDDCDTYRLLSNNLNWGQIFQLLDHVNRFPQIYRPHSGPQRWYDFGTLGLGNQLTHPEQQRTQMIVWCLFASPLFVSADFDTVDQYTLKLLKNPYLIALNQDRKGIAPSFVRVKDGLWIYLRQLSELNTWALAFVNPHGGPLATIVSLSNLNIPMIGKGLNKYKLTELTTDTEITTLDLNDKFDVKVKAFDTEIYKVQYQKPTQKKQPSKKP